MMVPKKKTKSKFRSKNSKADDSKNEDESNNTASTVDERKKEKKAKHSKSFLWYDITKVQPSQFQHPKKTSSKTDEMSKNSREGRPSFIGSLSKTLSGGNKDTKSVKKHRKKMSLPTDITQEQKNSRESRPTSHPGLRTVASKDNKDSKESKMTELKKKADPKPAVTKPAKDQQEKSMEKADQQAAVPRAVTPKSKVKGAVSMTQVVGPEGQVFYIEDIVDSDKDTECESSGSKKTESVALLTSNLLPPSIQDVFFRRIVFVRHAEAENALATGRLTKFGELSAQKSACELKRAQLYYAGVVISPSVRCLQTAKIFVRELDNSVNKSQICIEPGFADWIDKQMTHILEPRPLMGTLTPAQYTPSIPMEQLPKTETKAAFEKRIVKCVRDVIKNLKGSLLVICDAATMDASIRNLLELASFTERDWPILDAKYQCCSMVILDQFSATSPWSMQRAFTPLIVDKRNIYADINFVRRLQ